MRCWGDFYEVTDSIRLATVSRGRSVVSAIAMRPIVMVTLSAFCAGGLALTIWTRWHWGGVLFGGGSGEGGMYLALTLRDGAVGLSVCVVESGMTTDL